MKILKSKINRRILISVSKIGALFFGLLLFMSITGSFAYFTDTASIDDITVSTGCWVKPEIPQLLYPGNGYMAGATSAWTLNPYMDWTSSSTTCPLSTNIQYQYESYNDAGLTHLAYRSGLLSNSMIPAPGTPDGNYYWRARTFDGYNWSDWSEVWLLRVDKKCPSVKVTSPADSSDLSGTVEVRGTVTDLNPHHYWLVIENSSGTKVAGPGTVNDTTSFTDKKFFDWDTTKVPDGTYTIKLEARDELGNKCPNLAPVPSDPEDPNDSVDWISVTIDNTTEADPSEDPEVQPGDVVINEVYYDIDTATKGSDPSNEWVELYNNADQDISLKDWKIVDAALNEGTIDTDISIPAKGFAVLSGNSSTFDNWTLPSGAVVINTSGWPALNNTGDSLALKNPSGTEIDYVAWEGENGWSITANDGESIARRTKGVDTDSESDWEVLTSPNPGTNPHSFLNNGSQNSSEEVEAEEHKEQNSKDNQEENQNEENNEQNKNEDNDNEKEKNKEGDDLENSPGEKETLEEPKEKEAPSEEESKKEENSERDSEGDDKEKQ